MFITAAEAVAEQVTPHDFAKGLIYPQVKDILKVSVNVAVKIAEEVFNSGLAGINRREDPRALLKSKMFVPAYQ
jgi:malate dehydrogenase (oxaloacetate-decarboxylating)(NADP+)